jgi:hypothetical protein
MIVLSKGKKKNVKSFCNETRDQIFFNHRFIPSNHKRKKKKKRKKSDNPSTTNQTRPGTKKHREQQEKQALHKRESKYLKVYEYKNQSQI